MPHFILKPKYQDFHNETFVFKAEMIVGCLVISWGRTETRGGKKFFNPPHCLQNSTVLLQKTNPPKQLGAFIIVRHGKGAMYFSKFFLLV